MKESMTVGQSVRVPPSVLAKKVLCLGYTPRTFEGSNRLLFQGLHALATLRTIARHLRRGYTLKDVERRSYGGRLDLLFEDPHGRLRLSEVKSSKRIREVHKIQASLYS